MITTPWERQAAENFHKILEAKRSPAHDEMTPLATMAKRVQSLGAGPTMDANARDRLRTRLVAVASVQGIGSESEVEYRRKPTRALVPRRAALLSGTLAVLIALSGVGVASNGAVPGDALYSVKRSREAAQLALARSDASRGQLYLEFARTRLFEAESVQNNYTDLRRALDDMDADTRSAMRELGGSAIQRRDTAPLDLVDDFAAEQRRDLSTLLAGLSSDKQGRVLDSLTLLEQISERSGALRDSLACGGAMASGERSDELGPLPRRCTALPPVKAGGEPVPGSESQLNENGGTSTSSSPTATASPSGTPSGSASPSHSQLPGGNTGGATPSPSGGTSGVLGNLTGTVDGVLGGLLGPLLGK